MVPVFRTPLFVLVFDSPVYGRSLYFAAPGLHAKESRWILLTIFKPGANPVTLFMPLDGFKSNGLIANSTLKK
jgi:hypothetical protein